jgi:hypothetical protein
MNELFDVCNQGATLGVKESALLIERKVKELIENARNTSEPEQQLNLLNEALDEFYNNPGDVYG